MCGKFHRHFLPTLLAVFDFGLKKEDHCDTGTNLTYLKLEWASKSEMRQRSGRAGRVKAGLVYHLLPKSLFRVRPRVFFLPLLFVLNHLSAVFLNMTPSFFTGVAGAPEARNGTYAAS